MTRVLILIEEVQVNPLCQPIQVPSYLLLPGAHRLLELFLFLLQRRDFVLDCGVVLLGLVKLLLKLLNVVIGLGVFALAVLEF
jgi:hypothetical protein